MRPDEDDERLDSSNNEISLRNLLTITPIELIVLKELLRSFCIL